MNSDQKFSTGVSFFLMIATLTLGWFTLNDRLSLPKIVGDPAGGQIPSAEQHVMARLWEDPLQAIRAESAKGDHNHQHDVGRIQEMVRRKLEVSEQFAVLITLIPGTPFPDDGETRLRLRYSVQMALAHDGWSPEDRDHLGFARLAWPGPEGVHLSSGTNDVFGFKDFETNKHHLGKLDIPFEWFSRASGPTNSNPGSSAGKKSDRVLALWLTEEALASDPLCRLGLLARLLLPTPTVMQTNSAFATLTGIFVIGPRSSNMLAAFVEDQPPFRFSTDPGHVCAKHLREKLAIFSPEATAPDALIGLEPSPSWALARDHMNRLLAERLPHASSSNWIYFKNFIAPDDQLTDLLAEELKSRDVRLDGNQPDRILIFAEADTSYGKSLPRAMDASISSLREGKIRGNESQTPVRLANSVREGSSPGANGLIIARYLRGLDAQKGHQTVEQRERGSGKSVDQLLTDALNKKVPPALGESQLDYAERLAELVAKDASREQPVKAVGVLGGDIYDKLILLRALRTKFPEALYFTTDLDARLWHPDHLRFTRNMVVASAHGVAASPKDGEWRIPPFRDSYQVSVFHAVFAALQQARGVVSQSFTAPLPAVYELGRNGPVLLGRGDPKPSEPGQAKDYLARQLVTAWGAFFCELARAGGLLAANFFGSLLLALSVAVGAGVLCIRHRRGDDFGSGARLISLFRREGYWFAWFFLGAICLLIFSGLLFRGLSREPGGEPWSWSAGISIWPTEMVRLSVMCCVAWMLVWAWVRFTTNQDAWTKEFELNPVGSSGKALDKPNRFNFDYWRGAFLNVWSTVFQPWPKRKGGESESSAESIDINELFHCYLRKGGLGARFFRTLIGAGIYGLFGWGVMRLFGMPFNTHVRGETAEFWDALILSASIAALLILVFYVLDAVCLSANLLERLAKAFTVWPVGLLEKKAKTFGVNQGDLEGYFDVQFAASKTQATGGLIILPFIVQFGLLVARNNQFDNWRWPAALLFIFVGNMVLAAVGWSILRRAAARLRRGALKRLEEGILGAERNAAGSNGDKPKTAARRLGLLEIKRQIENERRGAYARWIQDPGLLALLLPTGLLGVLSVILQALFGFL